MTDQAAKFTCPRAVEDGAVSPVFKFGSEHEWRPDGTCSYCGSLSEGRFFEAVEAGEEVTPTDKPYKAYVRSAGGSGKFYFQHLSEEGRTRFVELANSKRMRLAFPGHFYVLPFFCRRADPPASPTASPTAAPE